MTSPLSTSHRLQNAVQTLLLLGAMAALGLTVALPAAVSPLAAQEAGLALARRLEEGLEHA